ncbi:outer membrane beta-barrel protein [Vibrio cincinnatiensis]|uniref:outer membrane beta-barrel protein n=1 Tax=Vibrio cincinnatiensis TaxID=675 RepID=UPI001EDE727A|nr:outer membrane beta-barrel protein [Vibrio cincinnatiensis]
MKRIYWILLCFFPCTVLAETLPYVSLSAGYHELKISQRAGYSNANIKIDGATELISLGVKKEVLSDIFIASELNVQLSQANKKWDDPLTFSRKITEKNSYGLGVLIGRSFENNYELYTKLGYQQAKLDFGANEREKFIGVRYGIGGQYNINSKFHIGLEYQYTDFDKELTEQVILGRLVQYF